MFVTVIKAFRDKETGYTLLPGAKVDLAPGRFETLKNNPYGVFVEEIIGNPEPPAEETPELAEPPAELKEEKKPKGSNNKK